MVYEIWLNRLRGYTYPQKRALLKAYGDFRQVYEGLRERLAPEDARLDEAEKILAECRAKDIFIKNFREYGIQDKADLPLILYCRGNWKPIYESIGIVGTRRCTEYGKKIAVETAEKLAASGVTVISGMARGIDGYAHSAAIKAGGYTVAVPGTGPDICFPAEHRSLMDAILNTGLIISEYPPGFHGSKSTFPQRNRIIAAFSDRLLLVESGEKGGALITAERAKAYGKEVYAVPGRLDSPESRGTNRLIAEGRAKLWLPEYCKSREEQLCLQLETEEKWESRDMPVLAAIKRHGGCIPLDELAPAPECAGLSLMEELTELELNDLIRMEGDIVWLR